MTQTIQKHPLSEISFLKPIDIKEISKDKTDTDLNTETQNPIKEDTAFSPIETLAHSLKKEISSLAESFEKSHTALKEFNYLNTLKKSPFSLKFFKNRQPVAVDFAPDKEGKYTIPVVRRPILSSHQIYDSKSLLSYCSDWVKSLFFDKAEFRALPGTGTILILLPHGNLRFVQFIYKDTPVHPTQLTFRKKISPIEIEVFHDFKSFRDWMYGELSVL